MVSITAVDDQLYVMSPLEIARGVVLDHDPPRRRPEPRQGPAKEVRAVLEDLLREALTLEPCVIAFSGGRDSSALLAVASLVARREGLSLPLPVTRRFPDLPETDETVWQERLVRHLDLQDWVVLDLDDHELDLIGPVAAPRLREHGVVWPPLMHVDAPLLHVARGGVIVDGEGGDQVFGMELHRIAPVAALIDRRRPPTPRHLARAAATVAPAKIRRRAARRSLATMGTSWLRPDALEHLVEDLARDVAAQALRWDDSIRGFRLHRAREQALHNRNVIAAHHDVAYLHPFLEQPFLDALARRGGWRGLGSRTRAMEALFHDVLPRSVLGRTSKARFNSSILGADSRDFAASWDGNGVDTDLVDPEALRTAWLSDRRHARAFPLLQAAWLASQALDAPVRHA